MTDTYTSFIDDIRFGGFNAIEYADEGLEMYISFQALLRWISKYPNMFSGKTQIIEIDWRVDKPMFIYSTTISCNLQKCYIQNEYLNTTLGTLSDSGTGIGRFDSISEFNDSEFIKKKEDLVIEAKPTTNPSIFPSIGNINYVYLNINFLSQLITKGSDNKDNKVTIRKFLQDVCDGVNKALGSINDLQVISNVDGTVEKLTIIDYQQKRIKNLVKLERPYTELKAQGLGSMLTKIQAQSSITPDLASMIAIGAQAHGQVVGPEAASFSKLSEGFIDRIYPEKNIGDSLDIIRQEKAKEAIEKRYKNGIESYIELIKNQQPKDGLYDPIILESTDKSNKENIAVELYKACLEKFTQTRQTSTAFIPIKLNLSLYGLSGIKIYQNFKLSNDILPLSYKGNFVFTTLGVSHTVDSSKWETTISALIGLEDEKVDTEGDLVPFTIPLNTGSGAYSPISAGFPNIEKPDNWPFYSDSDAVPSNIAPPSSAAPPSSSYNIRPNKTIKNEYLPLLNEITGYSQGLKMLALIMTVQEGFRAGTTSYTTNNPGNIGNTDAGGTNKFKTLKEGIQGQLKYVQRVAEGKHRAYPKGKSKTIEPYFSPEIARNTVNYQLNPYLPGYKFEPYTGTLEQFVKIYATGARGGNTYLSTIISFFKKNGSAITSKTTLEQLNKIKGAKKIIV